MIKKLFHQLGCSEKETETFITMLELGAQPASIVAKRVGIPRSSMYVILERLKRLNLIEEFKRMNITYFQCIPVRSMASLLKTKERQIEQIRETLTSTLPALEALENKLSITPQVRFFEGKKASMKVYEEVLQEKEFYAAFNPGLVKQKMPEYYYKIGEILEEKKGIARELLVTSKEATNYKKRFNSARHQIKILPEHMQFASDMIICPEKIYMIAYGKNDVSATEIINSSLAHTQRVLFEELWRKI